MDFKWDWGPVDDNNLALFRDGVRSRGRVHRSAGILTGFWGSHPVERGDDLDEVAEAVEVVARQKPWIPYRG